ncbi:general secretion pathway protein GspK [Pseudomonas syringae]|nr:general secretion pathway protein GspK [Pseudomonas syringae]MCF5069871.1 general secretion pathway protein GspK [Pseudomonas syringae]
MNGRERGMALISVLLVMSLALLITAGLLRSHRLLVQSTAQQLHGLQLRQQAVAAEAWALQRLQCAVRNRQTSAELIRDWPRSIAGFDHDDAATVIEIEDLAGRFNLNALLRQGQIDPVTLERWARLLTLLDLPPLPLNQVGELRDLSQLRLLPGIDRDVLTRLEPWAAILPPEAALNINAAPALLLRALDIPGATAEALVRQRSTTPWASVQGFTRDPLLDGLGLSSHGLGIDSRWFRLTVRTSRGSSALVLSTDVERDAKTHQLNVRQRRLLPSSDHEIVR